jgi:hypothetical protein
MILRPILISAFSRHHLLHFPNVVKQRPQRLRPVTIGAAALAFSMAVGLVHLDSDTFRDQETTVGGYVL